MFYKKNQNLFLLLLIELLLLINPQTLYLQNAVMRKLLFLDSVKEEFY